MRWPKRGYNINTMTIHKTTIAMQASQETNYTVLFYPDIEVIFLFVILKIWNFARTVEFSIVVSVYGYMAGTIRGILVARKLNTVVQGRIWGGADAPPPSGIRHPADPKGPPFGTF